MDENQEYLENLMDLFHRPGWKTLMEEMTATLAVTSNLDALKTQDQLMFAKGKREVLITLLNLEETVRQALDQDNAESI